MRKPLAPLALAAVPLAFLLVMLVAPALRLLGEGWHGQGDWFQALSAPWRDDYLRWRLVWSFVQGFATCALALAVGLPLAWVLARYEFMGRSAVVRALMLPFVVPTLVAALGVLALMGPHGWLVQWAGVDLQGTAGLLLYGNLFFNVCVVVRAGIDALEQVSASRIGAARSLGATPWRAFWRVEWPTIAPWMMSALCLVFLYCFSGFGLALVLGGQRYATVEVEIYTLVAHELQLAQAGVLALWVLCICASVAVFYAVCERRLGSPAKPDPLPRRRPQTPVQWALVWVALTSFFLVCALPLLAIVGKTLWAIGLPWGQGNAAWQVLIEEDTLAALWNTLRFSAAAVVLATVLGLLHALAARHSVLLRALAFLPFAVSAVMVAFGLLLLYPSWTANLALLIAAYAVLAYPFVAKSVAASLDSMPVHYVQAARSLGASPWRAFWRVTFPWLLPALRRGMAFAAATALGEFAVTLFLSRPEWNTLTTLIYQRLGRPGAANLESALLLACLLMLISLLTFTALEPKQGRHLKHA